MLTGLQPVSWFPDTRVTNAHATLTLLHTPYTLPFPLQVFCMDIIFFRDDLGENRKRVRAPSVFTNGTGIAPFFIYTIYYSAWPSIPFLR